MIKIALMLASSEGHKECNPRLIENNCDEPEACLQPLEDYQQFKLMSLEDATEPIESLFRNLPRDVWIAKNASKKPTDGLTSDESAAIHLYTMELKNRPLYSILNEMLRHRDRRKLKPWFPYLKLFLTALFKIKPCTAKMVYRGVKADLQSKYQRGERYTWWAFSSCTLSLEVLEDPIYLGETGVRTLFNVECTNGKPIKYHSYFKSEDEILLLPGFYFEVVGKVKAANGFHIIHIRQLSPPYTLLEPPFSNDLSNIPSEDDAKEVPVDYDKSSDTIETEISCLIWLDSNANIKESRDSRSMLGSLVNHFKTFDNVDECLLYIQDQSKTDRLVIIASGRFGREIVPDVHQLEQVMSIYIFCMDKERNEKWARKYSKIKAVLVQLDDVFFRIKLDHKIQNLTDQSSLAKSTKRSSGAASYTNSEVEALIESQANAEQIDLSRQKLNENDMMIVGSRLIKDNTKLLRIVLRCNEIGDEGVKYISDALKQNQTLINMDLHGCLIGPEGARYLSDALKSHQKLKQIWLANNQIGSKGAKYLSLALKTNQALIAIDLEGTQMGDEGVKYLSEALIQNQTLIHIHLKTCQIGDDGAKYISEALKQNRTLEKIWLIDNHIGTEGLKYLSDALIQNQTLTNISLGENYIDDEGAKYLSDALKLNKTLKDIDLQANHIGDKGAQYLAVALDQNQTLSYLYLHENKIGDETQKFLEDKHQKRVDLKMGWFMCQTMF